ncbi:hypothetical protein [Streptococcus intermedius]|uniref:hypothetical protein n=1 Tax=Streptococcus intermedius TaxID=1338 RepID=UPI000F62E18A|nr:hypothetical protein [Streptococcus intermedius]
MKFKVANKYLREANKTFVAIRCDEPYTAYDRVLEGDRMNDSDEILTDAVLKIVATELDPTGAIAEMQQKLDKTSDATNKNKDSVERTSKLTDVLILLAISIEGGMQQDLYKKVASLLPTLTDGVRYSFGDIVSAPYPYDTNPKYPQGTPVILKFLDNWTHKGQPLQELLQKGACTTIMPKLN